MALKGTGWRGCPVKPTTPQGPDQVNVLLLEKDARAPRRQYHEKSSLQGVIRNNASGGPKSLEERVRADPRKCFI
jgi:hypothetical protein